MTNGKQSGLGAWLVIAVFLVVAAKASGAAFVADHDALKHVGQKVTVEGMVTGTHVSARGTGFLDFGSRYPNQDFTVVIFARSAAEIGDIARFYGKRIDVTGAIELFKGRPEIIVTAPAQIRVAH